MNGFITQKNINPKFQLVYLGKLAENQLARSQNLLVTDEWTSVKVFTAYACVSDCNWLHFLMLQWYKGIGLLGVDLLISPIICYSIWAARSQELRHICLLASRDGWGGDGDDARGCMNIYLYKDTRWGFQGGGFKVEMGHVTPFNSTHHQYTCWWRKTLVHNTWLTNTHQMLLVHTKFDVMLNSTSNFTHLTSPVKNMLIIYSCTFVVGKLCVVLGNGSGPSHSHGKRTEWQSVCSHTFYSKQAMHSRPVLFLPKFHSVLALHNSVRKVKFRIYFTCCIKQEMTDLRHIWVIFYSLRCAKIRSAKHRRALNEKLSWRFFTIKQLLLGMGISQHIIQYQQ